ncbi:MAG: biopolymer transporter ExbD [Deltaproteobacteria bacterium]|nr:biopolymer transporter ExbD [Deltaproteobacteria bacterium]
MKITRKERHRARIEMIPLIDVVFLLLVAFVFFAMSMTVQRGIPVDLPASSAARVEGGHFSEVAVERGGTIFLDGEEVDIQILRVRLALLHRESPGTKVVVSGDREAPYESIVSVIDAVKAAGISRLSLRTKHAGEGPEMVRGSAVQDSQ